MAERRFEEPHEVWRVRQSDGRVAHATVVPNGFCCSLVWFVNGVVVGGEDRPDWETAVARAGQVFQSFRRSEAS
jgi:hypothetical protein